MSQSTPNGPYTLWEFHGYEGWSFTDFQTLEEALTYKRWNDTFTIQKPVKYDINEKE